MLVLVVSLRKETEKDAARQWNLNQIMRKKMKRFCKSPQNEKDSKVPKGFPEERTWKRCCKTTIIEEKEN